MLGDIVKTHQEQRTGPGLRHRPTGRGAHDEPVPVAQVDYRARALRRGRAPERAPCAAEPTQAATPDNPTQSPDSVLAAPCFCYPPPSPACLQPAPAGVDRSSPLPKNVVFRVAMARSHHRLRPRIERDDRRHQHRGNTLWPCGNETRLHLYGCRTPLTSPSPVTDSPRTQPFRVLRPQGLPPGSPAVPERTRRDSTSANDD